jgi:hypothetical protein
MVCYIALLLSVIGPINVHVPGLPAFQFSRYNGQEFPKLDGDGCLNVAFNGPIKQIGYYAEFPTLKPRVRVIVDERVALSTLVEVLLARCLDVGRDSDKIYETTYYFTFGKMVYR